MKQSEKLNESYQELRNRICSEIMLLVKKHLFDLEMAIEFKNPIFYGTGYDEQDNAPEIYEISEAGEAVIYYHGSETERFPMEQLDTEKLIEILEGLEASFEDLEKNV